MQLLAAVLAVTVGAVVLVFLVVAAMRAKGEPIAEAPPPLEWSEWDSLRSGTLGPDDRVEVERAGLATAGTLPRLAHDAPPRAGMDGIALPDVTDPTRSIVSIQVPHDAARARSTTDAAGSPPLFEPAGLSRRASERFDGGTGPRRA
ncbi:hypothetical protein GGF32_005780 [Allomyces javanicus]|nr:hypothetical protein GGF32_005780 [Allomyces javanicus]